MTEPVIDAVLVRVIITGGTVERWCTRVYRDWEPSATRQPGRCLWAYHDLITKANLSPHWCTEIREARVMLGVVEVGEVQHD